MRWLYAIYLAYVVAAAAIFWGGLDINSFGRGAYAPEPAYSRAIDAQVQHACHAANNDPGRKAAGLHMDGMQLDGRDYYCAKENT